MWVNLTPEEVNTSRGRAINLQHLANFQVDLDLGGARHPPPPNLPAARLPSNAERQRQLEEEAIQALNFRHIPPGRLHAMYTALSGPQQRTPEGRAMARQVYTNYLDQQRAERNQGPTERAPRMAPELEPGLDDRTRWLWDQYHGMTEWQRLQRPGQRIYAAFTQERMEEIDAQARGLLPPPPRPIPDPAARSTAAAPPPVVSTAGGGGVPPPPRRTVPPPGKPIPPPPKPPLPKSPRRKKLPTSQSMQRSLLSATREGPLRTTLTATFQTRLRGLTGSLEDPIVQQQADAAGYPPSTLTTDELAAQVTDMVALMTAGEQAVLNTDSRLRLLAGELIFRHRATAFNVGAPSTRPLAGRMPYPIREWPGFRIPLDDTGFPGYEALDEAHRQRVFQAEDRAVRRALTAAGPWPNRYPPSGWPSEGDVYLLVQTNLAIHRVTEGQRRGLVVPADLTELMEVVVRDDFPPGYTGEGPGDSPEVKAEGTELPAGPVTSPAETQSAGPSPSSMEAEVAAALGTTPQSSSGGFAALFSDTSGGGVSLPHRAPWQLGDLFLGQAPPC